MFILLALGAGIASVWAWPAYTYKFGDQVTVKYTGPCETSYGRRGGSSTDCPATWTVNGAEVRGELTDSVGEDIRGTEGELVTSVWGTTARTKVRQPEYLLGLSGPWVLLAAIALGITSGVLAKRRTRRRIAQGLEDPNADPLDLSDEPEPTPELMALEPKLGRPVAEYTGTTPIGWFLFGALLFGPLGYSLFQGIETVAEYVIAGCGVLAIGWGVLKVRRKKAWRATFFAGGLHVVQDKRVFTTTWREVTAVQVAITTHGASQSHKYTVWRDGEESFVFEQGWADIAELGQRLTRDTNRVMLPRYIESFEAGVALKFGELLVNRDGVSLGNAFAPWHAVTRFEMSVGKLDVVTSSWRSLQNVADIPNVQILMALADASRKRVTRVE